MNIETVNKIKSNINGKFAEIFTKEDLLEHKFIPINKQAGFFFIVTKEGTNKSELSEFIAVKDSDTLKFISLDEEGFNSLFDYYLSTFYPEDTQSVEIEQEVEPVQQEENPTAQQQIGRAHV